MIVALLIRHGDHGDSGHMGSGSVWMVVSMVAFAVLLLAFVWSLVRSSKDTPMTPADHATQRYAQGRIDAEEFERIVRDIKSHEA